MSCHGCSRKLCAFTQKELQTVLVAQKLLGAPTVGGGSAQAGGGGGGSQRSQICPHATPNIRKRRKNRRFPALFWLSQSARKVQSVQKVWSGPPKKHLIVPTKHYMLIFKFLPKIQSFFYFVQPKESFFFLKSDYQVLKNFFRFLERSHFVSAILLGMSQHPSTGIFKHVLHWDW